jgi:hypothetical protein
MRRKDVLWHTDGAVGYKTLGQYAENKRSVRHAHLLSKGKITFQSFFMLMTVEPFFFASS